MNQHQAGWRPVFIKQSKRHKSGHNLHRVAPAEWILAYSSEEFSEDATLRVCIASETLYCQWQHLALQKCTAQGLSLLGVLNSSASVWSTKHTHEKKWERSWKRKILCLQFQRRIVSIPVISNFITFFIDLDANPDTSGGGKAGNR